MYATTSASTRTKGETTLRRLFEIGTNRLRERGIEMSYSPAVIEWLLEQPDWQTSFNPLRTLHGSWHQQVGDVIEKLLLDRVLREGFSLSVDVGGTETGPRLQFTVTASFSGSES